MKSQGSERCSSKNHQCGGQTLPGSVKAACGELIYLSCLDAFKAAPKTFNGASPRKTTAKKLLSSSLITNSHQ